jgi:peptidoglycan/xylan/chitin deacetylase (PgdA/CDA1 family)
MSEAARAEAAIRRLGGRAAHLLRPPYGAVSKATRAFAARHGYRLVLWDVDPQDWRRPGSAAIAANVTGHARPGSVVLLHDGGGDRSQTIAALEQVLVSLTARGYGFRALK